MMAMYARTTRRKSKPHMNPAPRMKCVKRQMAVPPVNLTSQHARAPPHVAAQTIASLSAIRTPAADGQSEKVVVADNL
jgi:hypothetical protein